MNSKHNTYSISLYFLIKLPATNNQVQYQNHLQSPTPQPVHEEEQNLLECCHLFRETIYVGIMTWNGGGIVLFNVNLFRDNYQFDRNIQKQSGILSIPSEFVF